MAYNYKLANRIRNFIGSISNQLEKGSVHQLPIPRSPNRNGTRLEERQLFGALVFLVGGKMAFAVLRDDILIRTDQMTINKLSPPMIQLISSTGKPIQGWALLPKALQRPISDLYRWLNLGIRTTLPSDRIQAYPQKL